MKKFNDPKIEVIRFGGNDVIVTSGTGGCGAGSGNETSQDCELF